MLHCERCNRKVGADLIACPDRASRGCPYTLRRDRPYFNPMWGEKGCLLVFGGIFTGVLVMLLIAIAPWRYAVDLGGIYPSLPPMSNPERQPDARRVTDSDLSTTEWPDPCEGGNTRPQVDGPFLREMVPGPQRQIDQALERVIFLLARISREQEALADIPLSLKQSLDLLTEEVLDLAWLFGLVVSDFGDDELGQAGEDLDPRHFYAAYVFDQAHGCQDDFATLREQAQQLGYPVRYWRQSQAVDLRGSPDRLIVCVHRPSSAADAGMDLYETLKEREVAWDDLEAAAVDEYRLLGRPVEGPDVICMRDRTQLFAG